jgi:hypothetical protein
LVVVGVVGVIVLAAVGGASATTAAKDCGSITVQVRTGLHGHKPFQYENITAKGVSCSYAKSFIRKLNSPTGPPKGWKYSYKIFHGSDPIEAIWTKGNDRITYRYSCTGCSLDR